MKAKRLTIVLCVAMAMVMNLGAAKIKKVGVHPKVVTVADNRYTISEFENSSASEAIGRTAAVTTIAEAVTLLDGHGGIIQVENETPVDADLTVPSNVMLILPPTAVFRVASTKTLTLNCQVQGVVTNTGSGSVAYGSSYSSPTSFPGPVHEYYVDGGRTDTYTADGSITRPYSTVLLAVNAVNADVLVHAAAGTGAAANYVIHVGAGTYTDNLTITGPRYLRIEGAGVVISGTILINSGVGSYDHIEFVGQETGFSEKGPAMTLSGAMTCTRTNDSLIYVSFKGCYVTGNLATDTDGTWVLQYDGCRVNGTITGTFSASGHPAILLVTRGWNEFAGAISGKLAFYDANGSDFYGAINTTPYYASKFRDCSFASTVSIVPVSPADSTAINCDSNSLASLLGRTPTTTGAIINNLDNIGTTAAAKTVTLAANYIPVQANVVSVANPGSAYTLGGAYFKAATTTADQANTQIVGVIARASMGKNSTDVYGVQSHTTLVDGAESTGNMTAVSGKTILYDDNASGIVTAGLFTLEGQASATHGAVPRVPTTAYGVWADIVDTNITAGFVLNANNSAVGSGLTLTKSGTGAITKDITLQNGETIDNATDGTVAIGAAMTATSISATDITVGAGKTLNVSAGTLTLADNQISGDKVEGGTIAATTITTLTSTAVNSTTVNTGGSGAAAATGNVAVENSLGTVHSTVLTLTNVDIAPAAAAGGVAFGSVKLYDFPEGYLYVQGIVGDLALTDATATGSEMAGNFATWTAPVAPATWDYNVTTVNAWHHATGDATALTTDIAAVVGTTYHVSITMATSTAGGGLVVAMGGVTQGEIHGTNTVTFDFTASATTALTLTPDSGTWVGDVTALSVTTISPVSTTWDGDIALGTAADADGSLAGTEVNLIPSTATPQAVAGAATADCVSTATEHAIVDGHSTASDLVLNLLIDAADFTDAGTGALHINGTITVTWIKLGDN